MVLDLWEFKIDTARAGENVGYLRSDIDGTVLEKVEKSKKGVTPSPNEVQHDHKESKKAGGNNDSCNMQITTRKQNRDKGAK